MNDAEIICHLGVCPSFYEERRRWLDESADRRLFFIEERTEIPKGEDWSLLQSDRRVRIFQLESPLQIEIIAKQIARLSTLKKLLVLDEHWQNLIEPYCLEADSIISDAAEFGVRVFRHLQKNMQKPVRSFLSLHNAMAGIPAIVVGAGPSLETQSEMLKSWKDFGLIIATGTAILALDVEPDLGVAIDPHTPLLRRRFSSVPLCFQGRVHPDSLQRIDGEKLYMPDTHFLFEPWLVGQEIFPSGWTVGNVGVAMAVHLGCDPIILVGMDYCYRDQQKYAGQKQHTVTSPLIMAVDAKGQTVQTQSDWLLAIRWMEEFAAATSNRGWINATADGMRIGSPFLAKALGEIEKGSPGVVAKWNAALKKALPIELDRVKLAEWRASLKRCKEEPEGEVACELLLEPLWRIWEPLFERELMTDTHPISMKEKLQIQRRLFFEQIIDEHL